MSVLKVFSMNTKMSAKYVSVSGYGWTGSGACIFPGPIIVFFKRNKKVY